MLVNGNPGNSISVRDRGLLYGDGVFRTLRAAKGQVRHSLLHYKRCWSDFPVKVKIRRELDGQDT